MKNKALFLGCYEKHPFSSSEKTLTYADCVWVCSKCGRIKPLQLSIYIMSDVQPLSWRGGRPPEPGRVSSRHSFPWRVIRDVSSKHPWPARPGSRAGGAGPAPRCLQATGPALSTRGMGTWAGGGGGRGFREGEGGTDQGGVVLVGGEGAGRGPARQPALSVQTPALSICARGRP